jgi:lipid-binding SYLF domain-containing protein
MTLPSLTMKSTGVPNTSGTSGWSAWALRLVIVSSVLVVPAATGWAQSKEADRIRKATTVLNEIMAAPDRAIPRSVLEQAEGIAVFPSTWKAGLLIGGQRGRGLISVRDRSRGQWSTPAFLTLTGGSIGAQIGGQAVDVVLIVINRLGLENLLQNQFKVGGEAAAAAGPVGRDAEASTDLQLRAQILSYSRSRGLFLGISLKGSTVRQDQDSNEAFYGSRFRTRDIVLDGKTTTVHSPNDVAQWRATLAKYVPAK